MNLPGWITVIIVILMLVLDSKANNVPWLFYTANAVIMIALAAIPGTAGRNKYGEPPK